MPKYLLILGGADLDKRSGNADLAQQMYARYSAWIADLRARDRLVSSAKLHDQTGVRLAIRGGQVVEAPFVESKEAVGGIFVVQAESLEDAASIARASPVLDLQNGWVEVRLVEEPRPAS
jgi:hypothetical protein